MKRHGHATLRARHHRTLIRWSIRTSSRQTLGGKRLTCFTAAWIAGSSPGNDERERTKEIRRRNADRRNEYSAVANGHGRTWSARRTSIGVPPRFSSQGVFHRKGLSTSLLLPGTWRDTFLSIPLSGRYPPLPVP